VKMEKGGKDDETLLQGIYLSTFSKTHGISFSPETLEFVRTLGEGAFSKVDLCKEKTTGALYAVKAVQLASEEMNNSVIRELGVLDDLDESESVRYYGYYISDTALNVVLSYMDGGSLHDQLHKKGAFPEPVICALTRRMLENLSRLHKKRVLHRDIKPHNILLSRSGEIKFGDFNTSRKLRDSMGGVLSFTGSFRYMAPERFDIGQKTGFTSDVWSVGMVLAELSLGSSPYQKADVMVMADMCLFGDAPRFPEGF
jgi:serine/threonine protein kinase